MCLVCFVVVLFVCVFVVVCFCGCVCVVVCRCLCFGFVLLFWLQLLQKFEQGYCKSVFNVQVLINKQSLYE